MAEVTGLEATDFSFHPFIASQSILPSLVTLWRKSPLTKRAQWPYTTISHLGHSRSSMIWCPCDSYLAFNTSPYLSYVWSALTKWETREGAVYACWKPSMHCQWLLSSWANFFGIEELEINTKNSSTMYKKIPVKWHTHFFDCVCPFRPNKCWWRAPNVVRLCVLKGGVVNIVPEHIFPVMVVQ